MFSYLQGLNMLAGVFLYVLPEVDAFFTFFKFVTQSTPTYWIGAFAGAKAGAIVCSSARRRREREEHVQQRLNEKPHAICLIYCFVSVFI